MIYIVFKLFIARNFLVKNNHSLEKISKIITAASVWCELQTLKGKNADQTVNILLSKIIRYHFVDFEFIATLKSV